MGYNYCATQLHILLIYGKYFGKRCFSLLLYHKWEVIV